MDSIQIQGNNELPTINFFNNGNLMLSGRSIPIDSQPIYEPLRNFIDQLKVSEVNFDINLEYINSQSIKQIYGLLTAIENNNHVKQANIVWHFDADDEDSLTIGKTLEEYVRICKFEFLENAL